jgi:hypothetical protein
LTGEDFDRAVDVDGKAMLALRALPVPAGAFQWAFVSDLQAR